MDFDQYKVVSTLFSTLNAKDDPKAGSRFLEALSSYTTPKSQNGIETPQALIENIRSYTTIFDFIEKIYNDDSKSDIITRTIKIFLSERINLDLIPISFESVSNQQKIINNIISKENNNVKRRRIAIFQMAAILAENHFALASEIEGISFSLPIATPILIETASYMSWKAIEDSTESHITTINSSLKRFEDEKQEALSSLLSQLNEAQRRLLDMEKADIKTRERLSLTSKEWDEKEENSRSVNEELQNSSTHIALSISEMKDNWDSFKSSITEKVLGSETKKLWQDRSKENLLAFVGSAVILGVFLIVFPILGFYKLDLILETLKHIGDAATEGIPQSATAAQLTVATISRLVVITFPLVLYVWIIRLIVRFNSRSLLLHDDARQRQTMMDTYFLLIERQAATPEERGLILNALFRPAPGHGADNVEPPNFTEFIGKLDK